MNVDLAWLSILLTLKILNSITVACQTLSVWPEASRTAGQVDVLLSRAVCRASLLIVSSLYLNLLYTCGRAGLLAE